MTARTSGRQYPLVLTLDLTYENVLLAGTVLAQLPPGAVITGGEIVIDTVWNDTGASTVTVAVGTEAILTTTNLEAAARTALTLTSEEHTVADNVTVTLAAGNEDATAGAARLNIMYIVGGRANEVGEPGDA